jgi:diguanylate cyclase (GGDEF)-like protein
VYYGAVEEFSESELRSIEQARLQGYLLGSLVRVTLEKEELEEQNLQIAKGLFKRDDIIVELREMVGYDDLTDLLHRAPFEQIIEERFATMERASDRGRIHSLLVLDLDDFKTINDTLGHTEGDACLQQTSQAIKQNLHRDNDFACRWGGEEFVIFLGDTDPESAFGVARTIQQAINAVKPGSEPQLSKQLGATIGIAQFLQGSAFQSVFELADEAMLQAKKDTAGKNQIRFARQILEPLDR